MATKATELFEDIAGELGTGAGSGRFASAFVRSVNRALGQLSTRTDLATPLAPIAGTSDDLPSQILQQDMYVIYLGARFYLLRAGFAPSDPKLAAAMLQDSLALWDDAMGDFQARRENATQATSTNDIAELGSRE